MDMRKIELDIVALSHSVTQSHNYAVVLGEQHGTRRLPIVIGGFEAQAIAVAMERMTPNRPLTHAGMFQKISRYFGEVKAELQKATWPWDPKEKGFKKYRELIDSTVVVFIAMILLGAFVSFADFIMVKVMAALTSI